MNSFKNKQKFLLMFSTVLLSLVLWNCKPVKNEGIQMSSESSSPGDVVILQSKEFASLDSADIQPFFDKQRALIVRKNKGDNTIAVMVPDMPAGKVNLSIKVKDKTISEAGFTIEDAATNVVYLSLKNNEFRILNSKKTSDEITQFQGTQ